MIDKNNPSAPLNEPKNAAESSAGEAIGEAIGETIGEAIDEEMGGATIEKTIEKNIGKKNTLSALLRPLKKLGWSAAALLFLWAVWTVAHDAVKNEYLLPSFVASMKSLGRFLSDKVFWSSFFATFFRSLQAFLFSFLAAFIFALVATLLPRFSRFFAPIISAVRSLPTMAVMLMLLVWTTPKQAPVAVAFLALFPLLYTGIKSALDGVSKELREMSRVYRVPLYRRIFRLYVPSAAPYVLKESSSALSFSLKLTVSAEVLANTYQSVGGMMQDAKLYAESGMSELFALTAAVVVAGFLLEGAGGLLVFAVERGRA